MAETELSRPLLVETARRLFALGEALDWHSYDPYDILLSPFTAPLAAHAPLTARALLQLGKRSGARLRRALRVPPHEEPKALADFLRASAILDRAGEHWAASQADVLSRRLRAAAARTPEGWGWGIRFPWVSRYGTMAAGEPNIYTTTAACQALLDDHELRGDSASLEAARKGSRFLLDGLGSFTFETRSWLRYNAGSTSPIINIQASSAALFARVDGVEADERLRSAADVAAALVVETQQPDGSWPYGADARGRFVDGFHTGFTLEGLGEYVRRRGDGAVRGAAEALDAGFAYFKQHLVSRDGLPLGFADGQPSRDGQTIAQAIQTLVSCGRQRDEALAARIWLTSSRSDRLEQPFPALRWTLGPFALATAYLLRSLNG